MVLQFCVRFFNGISPERLCQLSHRGQFFEWLSCMRKAVDTYMYQRIWQSVLEVICEGPVIQKSFLFYNNVYACLVGRMSVRVSAAYPNESLRGLRKAPEKNWEKHIFTACV